MEAVKLLVAAPLSLHCNNQFSPQKTIQQFCTTSSFSPCTTGSRRFALLSLTTCFSGFINLAHNESTCLSAPTKPEFIELPDSGGVKVLELRVGDGDVPVLGDKVAIHYYGRLAAKQGWRFDSTYDHKDETGEAIPFEFVLGSGKVISGIESAVKSMKVGSI